MSLAQVFAALEEFTEEVSSEIATPVPTDGEAGEPIAGVDFTAEADDIDSDVATLTDAAQGLEDIISLIEEAPGADDAPLDTFAQKAANVALESNDLVAAAGNPLALTGDKGHTKSSAVDKVKAFAAKVWEMLRKFGAKIMNWIKSTWAQFTDRIVKNANAAKKIIAAAASLPTKDGATITDKALLAAIATAGNVEIGDALLAVTEHANEQGGKASEALTKEARSCIDVVANGAGTADNVMDKFLDTLAKAAGSYKDKASPAQAQAVKAAAGTETYLSAPFFGGFRAWTSIPENVEALQHWNHGISKVDEVKPQESIAAPNGEEIKAIAEHIVAVGALVAVYQANLKKLDELNKSLDKAAGKAKNIESESNALKQMQAVVPRIIKGPQVAAYAYAVQASTLALRFCSAAVAAHSAAPEGKEKPAE